MVIIVKLIMESFRFAWNSLKMNIFRTTLSLLGVTVGIFAIIGVFTLVDSLEKSIKDSFSFLGAGTIYVNKWPFTPDFHTSRGYFQIQKQQFRPGSVYGRRRWL